MRTFYDWLNEANETLWTVRVWTRHSRSSGYQGIYNSEAEAFAAAMKEKYENAAGGYMYEAVPMPEKHKDELMKYGMYEPGM